MNKQPQITEKTRKNLMDAFWKIYMVKRIEKITVKEITAKAGYNRGTFYEYFTDVFHLLDEIEEQIIPTVDELPAFTTASGTFGIPMEQFLKLYEENNQYYIILLGEKGDPKFAAKLKKQLKQALLQLFECKSANQKEIDYILEYTLSAMIGTMSYWFSQNQNISKEHLIKLIRDLSEQGIMKQLTF